MQVGATQYNNWIPNGCPPGLEYLAQIDQVFIKKHVDMRPGGTTGAITHNKYVLMNSAGQHVS